LKLVPPGVEAGLAAEEGGLDVAWSHLLSSEGSAPRERDPVRSIVRLTASSTDGRVAPVLVRRAGTVCSPLIERP
jgi:hypothetical protein